MGSIRENEKEKKEKDTKMQTGTRETEIGKRKTELEKTIASIENELRAGTVPKSKRALTDLKLRSYKKELANIKRDMMVNSSGRGSKVPGTNWRRAEIGQGRNIL